MARLDGSSLKIENHEYAVLRLCQALHAMGNSLVEFREVENLLKLETAARADNGTPDDLFQSSGFAEARPNLLLVAGILKEMLGTLVSDIKANGEVQKLLPEIEKCSTGLNDRGVFEDIMISKQPSAPNETESEVCFSGTESGAVHRVAAACKSQVRCSHSCQDHPELVDRWLWRKLPEHLVELVCAHLPMPQIMDLSLKSRAIALRANASNAWAAMSESSTFRRVCAGRHPRLFGFLGLDGAGFLCITMYDIESEEWHSISLDFPGNEDYRYDEYYDHYAGSMHASDGGLVCFVPKTILISCPIMVYNPLTNDSKSMPPVPSIEYKENVLVQLVMDEDRKCYKVILVRREKTGGALAADCYYSKTGQWSKMVSGLVYRTGRTLLSVKSFPHVFDCRENLLVSLDSFTNVKALKPMEFSVVANHLFVLHAYVGELENGRDLDQTCETFGVSQFSVQALSSSPWQLPLRRLNTFKSTLRVLPAEYDAVLFASKGFVVFFVDSPQPFEPF